MGPDWGFYQVHFFPSQPGLQEMSEERWLMQKSCSEDSEGKSVSCFVLTVHLKQRLYFKSPVERLRFMRKESKSLHMMT